MSLDESRQYVPGLHQVAADLLRSVQESDDTQAFYPSSLSKNAYHCRRFAILSAIEITASDRILRSVNMPITLRLLCNLI